MCSARVEKWVQFPRQKRGTNAVLTKCGLHLRRYLCGENPVSCNSCGPSDLYYIYLFLYRVLWTTFFCNYALPKTRLRSKSSCAFSLRAPKLWNPLPEDKNRAVAPLLSLLFQSLLKDVPFQYRLWTVKLLFSLHFCSVVLFCCLPLWKHFVTSIKKIAF